VQLVGNTTQTLEASFHEKNSLDQLPVLEYTDPLTGEAQSLTQSLAIIEFLEEAYPATHRVLPTSVTERARARQVRWLPCLVSLALLVLVVFFLFFVFKLVSLLFRATPG